MPLRVSWSWLALPSPAQRPSDARSSFVRPGLTCGAVGAQAVAAVQSIWGPLPRLCQNDCFRSETRLDSVGGRAAEFRARSITDSPLFGPFGVCSLALVAMTTRTLPSLGLLTVEGMAESVAQGTGWHLSVGAGETEPGE